MSDQNVFGGNNEEVTPQEQQPTNTPNEQPPQGNLFADQLSSIRNEEGKPKYDSVDKALEALKHSQEFIPQLKRENEELKRKLEELSAGQEKMGKIDELLERLAAKGAEEGQPAGQSLDEQSVLALLEKQLEQRDKATVAQQNVQAVQSKLKEKFGDKAADAVRQKAEELGTTPEELGMLAERNPKMVLAYFGASPQKTNITTPGQNTASIASSNTDEGLQRPQKSLLAGATAKEQAEYMKKVREEVYKRLGVTS